MPEDLEKDVEMDAEMEKKAREIISVIEKWGANFVYNDERYRPALDYALEHGIAIRDDVRGADGRYWEGEAEKLDK